MRVFYLVWFAVALSCSASSTPSSPSDAGTDAALDAPVNGPDAAKCDAPFQNLVFSALMGVSGGAFTGVATGENSGGQPFLTVKDGTARSFHVEFYDTALPPVKKTFDLATPGQLGGHDSVNPNYVEGNKILIPVPGSGTVTVICSSGRFLAVTLKDVVLKGDTSLGGSPNDSITINGSLGATIP